MLSKKIHNSEAKTTYQDIQAYSRKEEDLKIEKKIQNELFQVNDHKLTNVLNLVDNYSLKYDTKKFLEDVEALKKKIEPNPNIKSIDRSRGLSTTTSNNTKKQYKTDQNYFLNEKKRKGRVSHERNHSKIRRGFAMEKDKDKTEDPVGFKNFGVTNSSRKLLSSVIGSTTENFRSRENHIANGQSYIKNPKSSVTNKVTNIKNLEDHDEICEVANHVEPDSHSPGMIPDKNDLTQLLTNVYKKSSTLNNKNTNPCNNDTKDKYNSYNDFTNNSENSNSNMNNSDKNQNVNKKIALVNSDIIVGESDNPNNQSDYQNYTINRSKDRAGRKSNFREKRFSLSKDKADSNNNSRSSCINSQKNNNSSEDAKILFNAASENYNSKSTDFMINNTTINQNSDNNKNLNDGIIKNVIRKKSNIIKAPNIYHKTSGKNCLQSLRHPDKSTLYDPPSNNFNMIHPSNQEISRDNLASQEYPNLNNKILQANSMSDNYNNISNQLKAISNEQQATLPYYRYSIENYDNGKTTAATQQPKKINHEQNQCNSKDQRKKVNKDDSIYTQTSFIRRVNKNQTQSVDTKNYSKGYDERGFVDHEEEQISMNTRHPIRNSTNNSCMVGGGFSNNLENAVYNFKEPSIPYDQVGFSLNNDSDAMKNNINGTPKDKELDTHQIDPKKINGTNFNGHMSAMTVNIAYGFDNGYNTQCGFSSKRHVENKYTDRFKLYKFQRLGQKLKKNINSETTKEIMDKLMEKHLMNDSYNKNINQSVGDTCYGNNKNHKYEKVQYGMRDPSNFFVFKMKIEVSASRKNTKTISTGEKIDQGKIGGTKLAISINRNVKNFPLGVFRNGKNRQNLDPQSNCLEPLQLQQKLHEEILNAQLSDERTKLQKQKSINNDAELQEQSQLTKAVKDTINQSQSKFQLQVSGNKEEDQIKQIEKFEQNPLLGWADFGYVQEPNMSNLSVLEGASNLPTFVHQPCNNQIKMTYNPDELSHDLDQSTNHVRMNTSRQDGKDDSESLYLEYQNDKVYEKLNKTTSTPGNEFNFQLPNDNSFYKYILSIFKIKIVQ